MSTQRVFQMLGNESVWEVTNECHDALAQAGIPHAIIGGLAVCLHGYQRNTVDLDLLIQAGAQPAVRAELEAAGFVWLAEAGEFRSPAGVPVQLLFGLDRAGPGSEVRLPDPGDESAVTVVE